MKSSPSKFLPLHSEIVVAATKVDKIWDKTFSTIFKLGSSETEPTGFRHIDGRAISLKLVDPDTAKFAAAKILEYQQVRRRLKYRFRHNPASQETFKIYTARYGERIRVHSDDYIPG